VGVWGGLESPTGFTARNLAHIVYQQVAHGVKFKPVLCDNLNFERFTGLGCQMDRSRPGIDVKLKEKKRKKRTVGPSYIFQQKKSL
jgi:hypothetical protein